MEDSQRSKRISKPPKKNEIYFLGNYPPTDYGQQLQNPLLSRAANDPVRAYNASQYDASQVTQPPIRQDQLDQTMLPTGPDDPGTSQTGARGGSGSEVRYSMDLFQSVCPETQYVTVTENSPQSLTPVTPMHSNENQIMRGPSQQSTTDPAYLPQGWTLYPSQVFPGMSGTSHESRKDQDSDEESGRQQSPSIITRSNKERIKALADQLRAYQASNERHFLEIKDTLRQMREQPSVKLPRTCRTVDEFMQLERMLQPALKDELTKKLRTVGAGRPNNSCQAMLRVLATEPVWGGYTMSSLEKAAPTIFSCIIDALEGTRPRHILSKELSNIKYELLSRKQQPKPSPRRSPRITPKRPPVPAAAGRKGKVGCKKALLQDGK